jgi:trehalose monomycolate/heme transporter
MLAKVGGFLYRARISALGISLTLVIVAAVFGIGVFSFLSSSGYGADNSDSTRAIQLLNNKLGSSSPDVILLLKSKSNLKATDKSFMDAATALFSKIRNSKDVASLTSYYDTSRRDFISANEDETFAILQLKGEDTATKQKQYTSLEPQLTSNTLEVQKGGSIPINVAVNKQIGQDLERAEVFTFPILALLLLVVFGGVIAAFLPLLIGGVAIMGAFAVLRLLSNITEVSVYAINVVTMLGLGLAIDYALFIITRFREELAHNGQNVRAALERTMATAGRTVIFSALTVSTSLLSLLLFPLSFLRSMGMGAIAAILVVMLASLTILPALLALLGPRINALSLRRIIRPRRAPRATGISVGATNAREQQGAWYRLSEVVMRWPVPVTLVVLAILFTVGVPFLHITFATPDVKVLPADREERLVSERLSQDFAQQGNGQLVIAVTTHGDALSADNLASLDGYVKSIQAVPGVEHVQSLVTVSPNLNLAQYQQLYAQPDPNPLTQAKASLVKGDFTKVTVAIQPPDHSDAATTLVKQVRAIQPSGGLTAVVGGTTPQQIDILAGIDKTLPYAFLVIVASIFVLLFLMTGSIIMPVKAIILNILSLSATFGGLVWIFQDGHLENLLHFQSLGSIDATQPVLIFAIAFGLSMDYEVFLLSRIKERFDETGNNRQAVSSGIQRTGWLITSAALLLAVVLGAFGTARIIFIQEIGIGLAIAVIMDATLIRMLLVPATMRLLGTINWWAPAPLHKLWQRIGLVETDSTLAPVPVGKAKTDLDAIVS